VKLNSQNSLTHRTFAVHVQKNLQEEVQPVFYNSQSRASNRPSEQLNNSMTINKYDVPSPKPTSASKKTRHVIPPPHPSTPLVQHQYQYNTYNNNHVKQAAASAQNTSRPMNATVVQPKKPDGSNTQNYRSVQQESKQPIEYDRQSVVSAASSVRSRSTSASMDRRAAAPPAAVKRPSAVPKIDIDQARRDLHKQAAAMVATPAKQQPPRPNSVSTGTSKTYTPRIGSEYKRSSDVYGYMCYK